MYRNVVWHSYKLHYADFKRALEDFNQKLVNANLTVNGPIFYALHNVPLDEMMEIDLYVPVEQTYVSREKGLLFQTYLYVDGMLMTRVKGNYEENTEVAYAEIFHFVEDNDLQIASPIFHILRGDDEVQWIELKVKVLDPNENESQRQDSLLDKYTQN